MTNPFGAGLRMEQTSTRRKEPGLTSDSYADVDGTTRDALDPDDPLAAIDELTAAPKAVVKAFPGKGYCLEQANLERVAKRLIAMLDDYEELMPERRARWKVSDKRRRGVVGVQMLTERTSDDRLDYVVYTPPGSKATAPTFNKLNRLCRRLKSNVFVDPFVPEATPGEATGSDDSEAAEFTTRALQAETGPSQLDLHKIGKRAFDLASTFDSGYTEFFIHPRAGGRQPKQIEASPAATTVEDAIFTTVLVPVEVQVGVDPMSGQPIMQPDPMQPPKPMRVAQPGPYVMRYVRADGSLTDDRLEADRVWMPRVRAATYASRQVRLLPANCTGVEDAEVIMIGDYVTLGELRERLQLVREMDATTLRKMIEFEPKHPRDFLPAHLKKRKGLTPPAGRNDEDGAEDDPRRIPDQTHVFVLKVYFKDTGEYEDGAYLLIGGDTQVLHRQPLVEQVNGEPVKLPCLVAQMKQFEDGTEDPEGRGAAHILGGGNEVRAALVGNLIESLYKINTAKTFYTPASMFQPKSASIADLYVPIEQGTEPKREQVSAPPQLAYDLLELSGAEMDDEIGLSPVAQGEAPPSVQSGLHAQTLIEQTLVGLSDVKQNVTDYYVRSWRILLALMRCYYPPQLLQQFLGDDQPHKLDNWMASELATNVDLRLLAGSGTMLAPSAKMAVGEYAASLGMLDQGELRRVWIGNAGGLIGAQDDPHLARIGRQMRRFLKGPPKEVDPSTWPQLLAEIWAILPNDEEPMVAQLRHSEMTRTMSSTRYTRLDPMWQVGFASEYQRMRLAAGVYTLAEQQAAAQAAQMQAAAAEGGTSGGGPPAAPQSASPATPPTAGSGLAPEQGASTPLAA